jgi:TM2 domain-containing membrane protein YozV
MQGNLMSDTSQGEGWWLASDGKWYPPQPTTPGSAPAAPMPGGPPAPGFNPNVQMSDKSKMTAGLLGIFLGGFGVHNFYLGYTNKAILQIVVTFFTCGIGAIWGLVEGIMIITGNESFQYDADGRRLTE